MQNLFQHDLDRQFLIRYLEHEDFIKFCSLNRYFNEKICKEDIFRDIIYFRYPLLAQFKENENWKEFYLKMSYYITKLEQEFEIPYIPAKGYNPERFYKYWKYSNVKESKMDNILNGAILWAVLGGRIDIVKSMLNKSEQRGLELDLNWIMIEAAEFGHINIVHLMIEKGAAFFNNALFYAAKGGHLKIVQLMIEKGANYFEWAIDEAKESGHEKIAEYLQQFI